MAEYHVPRRTHPGAYVGHTVGLSARIAKGVYVRSGAFKGRPVQTTALRHIHTGTLVLTTKTLYSAGSSKALRVPNSKIVQFHPYSNGIDIHRDAASPKPQVFVNNEGWFTVILSTLLAKSSQQATRNILATPVGFPAFLSKLTP